MLNRIFSLLLVACVAILAGCTSAGLPEARTAAVARKQFRVNIRNDRGEQHVTECSFDLEPAWVVYTVGLTLDEPGSVPSARFSLHREDGLTVVLIIQNTRVELSELEGVVSPIGGGPTFAQYVVAADGTQYALTAPVHATDGEQLGAALRLINSVQCL